MVLAKYASKFKPSSLFLNYCLCSKNFSVRKGCFVSKISQLNSTQSSKAKQGEECGKKMHVNKNRVMMTEEQMEVLRQQIAAYAIISDQLVQMHKAFSAQHTHSGMRQGSLYYDPWIASSGQKMNIRQRWSPTTEQLQILERIFEEDNGTPNNQRIKEITTELAQHGKISDSNVYNWFQNRRARLRRKQSVPEPQKPESETGKEVQSLKEKKMIPESTLSYENSAQRSKTIHLQQSPEISTEMLRLNSHSNEGEPTFPSDSDLSFSGSLGHMSFVPTPGTNRLGEMEVPGNYNPYCYGEGYDMAG
nr:WUSCHEL-related homeobox 8-like [Quercus suber]POF16020.1 wuschel-related homeobox 13 [Quercus suber]